MYRVLSFIILLTVSLTAESFSSQSVPGDHNQTDTFSYFDHQDHLTAFNAQTGFCSPQTQHKKISTNDGELLTEAEPEKANSARSVDVEKLLQEKKELDNSKVGNIIQECLNNVDEMFIKFDRYKLISELQKLLKKNHLEINVFCELLTNILIRNIQQENSDMFYVDNGVNFQELRNSVYVRVVNLYKENQNKEDQEIKS